MRFDREKLRKHCDFTWCVKASVCKSVFVQKLLCVTLCVQASVCKSFCVQKCLCVKVFETTSEVSRMKVFDFFL